MSDDSFIHEVNEEIRRERAHALWGRYGPLAIGFAIFLIVLTALYQIYGSWQASKEQKNGDMFLEALALEEKGDVKEALVKLDQVKKADFSVYPILALMQEAALKQKSGDYKGAITLFDQISQNKDAPEFLRYIAQIRAAYILVDHGSVDQVKNHVADLVGGPLEASAWEAEGFAQWNAGHMDLAAENFKKILERSDNIQMTTQARMMLELIESHISMPKQSSLQINTPVVQPLAPSLDPKKHNEIMKTEKTESEGIQPTKALTKTPSAISSENEDIKK